MADKKISELPSAGALNGVELVAGLQGGATVTMIAQNIANLAPIQDHNLLVNLTAGDPHTQYLTTGRGDLRYIPQTRQINTTAASGLTGGGVLTANLSLSVKTNPTFGLSIDPTLGLQFDLASIGGLSESVDNAADRLVMYNASETRARLVSFSQALAAGSGFVPTSRVIGSGNGLTGGGDLSADRNLAVGAGVGIIVLADTVDLDTTHARNADHSAISVVAGTGLSGGGTIAASRTLSLDTASARNTDHAAVAITGINSVSGGGDLTANRSLQLVGDSAAPGALNYYGTNGSGVKGYFPISGLQIAWGQISGTKNADQLQGFVLGDAGSANSIPFVDSSGILRSRVIANPGGLVADGLYIGYNNGGGAAGLTRIYGGGSTTFALTMDAAGNASVSGNVTAFSDRRLKKNITTITYALELVNQLRGVRYTRRDTGDVQIGVIAQEVEGIVPEVVKPAPEGDTLTVCYGNLVGLLIEAIKELTKKVEVLEGKVS